jgi:DNA-binding NarL/FixJ family response regulator
MLGAARRAREGFEEEPLLMAAGPSGRLVVRFLRAGSGEADALPFEERRGPPSPEELRGLGLTPREAAVMALVAEGRSDHEVADALVLSARTVQKHLEHVYAKLGVHSRTAAVSASKRD